MTHKERIRYVFLTTMAFSICGYLGVFVLSMFVNFDQRISNVAILGLGIMGAVYAGIKSAVTSSAKKLRSEWYVAHIVMKAEYKGQFNLTDIPVWENIVLISATSDDEAFDKAEKFGRLDVDEDFTWSGRPAKWIYVGVRKIVKAACENLTDGCELTYNELLFHKNAVVDSFALGDGCRATFPSTNVMEHKEPEFWLTWFQKKGLILQGAKQFVGETLLKDVDIAGVRSSFGLQASENPGDCFEVGQNQVDWLKSKGQEVELDKYDYFVEITAP